MRWLARVLYLSILSFLVVSGAVSGILVDEYPGFVAPIDSYIITDTVVSIEDDVIYKRAYYSENGNDWQRLQLTGELYTRDDRWLVERASATIPYFGPGEHYVIVYSCTLQRANSMFGENNWDCHNNTWQLRVLNIEERCQRHNSTACYDGDLWWYDGCGQREDRKEACAVGCEEGACLAPADNTIALARGFELGVEKPYLSIESGELAIDNSISQSGEA